MRVLSAASVLVTLVFCTAEDIVPRWSKPDGVRSQGEWVPLKDDRISQQPIRIPSAITSPRYNHERAFLHQSPVNQFVGDFPKQQMVASQTSPQRVAFVNPHNLGQQQILQPQLQTQLQPQLPQQLDSQQLLTQFLNQQIQQGSLPIFNRALLQKQPDTNQHYFAQPNQFSIVPMYSHGQINQNEQYTDSDEREIDGKVLSKEPVRQVISDIPYEEQQKSNNKGETFNNRLPSVQDSNQKEEIQILYVPVEMLKKQEQASKGVQKSEQNQAKELYNSERQEQIPEILEINQKDSRKFRHPIQPLKEQVPAHYLKRPTSQGKASYSNSETSNEDIKLTKPLASNRDYDNHKTHSHSRGEYISNSKEQHVDESTIKDEISDYRHAEQDGHKKKDYISKPEPSLPPPNQPPLSVFMEKTASNRIGDLINFLRGSKTIPVLDSVGPSSPHVFVGPSNLQTPSGYIKYELPYLSSLDNYQTGNKLSQVPFFVAPLNFQPPPGFAKIPFPPPHIGSVVLSNITQNTYIDQFPITQPSPELRTSNYNKEAFTIPADISSISPQLPSLINSLQEEEYSSSSSTETLTEPTEAPTIKHRRPTNSRRFNSRGSQRGSVSYASTTRKPVSRQRRPLNRNSNHRTNHYSEVVTNVPETSTENHYDTDMNYYHYKSNKDLNEKVTSEQNLSESPHHNNDERLGAGIQYTGTIENVKQEETSKESDNPGSVYQNPSYNTKYSNDETVATSPERTLNVHYNSPEVINRNVGHSNFPKYQNTQNSGETYDEYHTTNYNDKVTRNNFTPSDKQYPAVSTTRKYDEPVYNQETKRPLAYIEESSIASDYEDISYGKRPRENNNNKSPGTSEQTYNYRQKEQKIEPAHMQQDADYSRESLNKETINLHENEGEHEQLQQPIEDAKNINSPYNRYVTSNEEHNSTPYIQKSNYEPLSQESIEPYRDVQVAGKLSAQKKHNYNESPDTDKKEDFNERTHYDVNVSEPKKPVTERTFPTRSRVKGRGRTYHQQKLASTEPSVITANSNEESLENSRYSKSEVTTLAPGRRYSHGNRAHRRPLRPTVSTTTTTTTNAPPGTKYLIRTRRPSVQQTKLHNGRGRIRRPTTPTTTVPTTTTEHLQTLPILWQQPHRLNLSNNGYRQNDGTEQTQPSILDSAEYIEETPQYSDERVNDKSAYEFQNQRGQPLNKANHKLSENNNPRRIPNYSYESQEENFPTQKQFHTTPQPYYSDEYRTTPKAHYSRNYEITQKQQYFREYETTPKPHYPKEYETTQKAYYPRDSDTTQKTHNSREYDITPKPHYPRDYETTQKTQYFREYETTNKPSYPRDYETTIKQQYIREYETTQKPQYYRDYETTQNPAHFRNHDTNGGPKFYNDYDTTKKAVYSSDYRETDFTEKPKSVKEDNYYATTKKTVSYQDYGTTSRPYNSDTDSNQKETDGHISRQPQRSNHRRRPSSVPAKSESSKPIKNTRGDAPMKNSDPDYWNQAVTIQQSQSYVFNPDETYSDERQSNSPADSKFEPSQNDYEDYYNTQESEQQYSSDQSPYPSNQQRYTYTQIKVTGQTGKASQYPSKDEFRSVNDTLEEESTGSQQAQSSLKDLYKTKGSSNEGNKINLQIPNLDNQGNPSRLAESDVLQSSKLIQGNKPRGTWVRRKIKKPKDVFETAESQRFSSVRENSLVSAINPKEQQINNYTKEKFNGKQKEKNHLQNETSLSDKVNESNDTISINFISEQKNLETKENQNTNEVNDFVTVTEAADEITTQSDETSNIYQTPSMTTVSSDTETINETSEPFRTSTTTEISLETEICYKGQCIKSKRKKENGELNPMSSEDS